MKKTGITDLEQISNDTTIRKTADGRISGGIAFIYGLIDPFSNELKYVGKAKNPTERLTSHLAEANSGRSNSPKNQWLSNLPVPPKIVILGQCAESDWPEIEKRWISLSQDMQDSLTNLRAGGEGQRSEAGFPQLQFDLAAADLGCSANSLEAFISDTYSIQMGILTELGKDAWEGFDAVLERVVEKNPDDVIDGFLLRVREKINNIKGQITPDMTSNEFAYLDLIGICTENLIETRKLHGDGAVLSAQQEVISDFKPLMDKYLGPRKYPLGGSLQVSV